MRPGSKREGGERQDIERPERATEEVLSFLLTLAGVIFGGFALVRLHGGWWMARWMVVHVPRSSAAGRSLLAPWFTSIVLILFHGAIDVTVGSRSALPMSVEHGVSGTTKDSPGGAARGSRPRVGTQSSWRHGQTEWCWDPFYD